MFSRFTKAQAIAIQIALGSRPCALGIPLPFVFWNRFNVKCFCKETNHEKTAVRVQRARQSDLCSGPVAA
ncbi:hypothetical protein GCM10008938_10990 [Deinococcus roseus]|uniref:Secreted protein n=1 Tax=Deinococcus roseus TaxID=392414 RepID=A0ABQ2CW49_9DEIO|nr:hypothetical protein GCM10008938_10990 [Deinococcus roseus]